MPNWCNNTLNVSGSKEEIARFKEMVKADFVIDIAKEGIEERIKNFLSADHYKDNIKEYLRLKKLSSEEILSKELRLIKDEQGNWGKEPSVLSFGKLFPCPKEIKNNTSPTRIITEKEYEAQEKRIAEGKLTDAEKRYGVTRGITEKMQQEFKKKFGADNWYDWQIANWGTKWEIETDNLQEEETSLFYVFDTAWSPPTNWLEKVCTMFPKLEFTLNYEEGGCGFQGEAYAFEGNFSDNCWDWDGYNEDDDDYDDEDEQEVEEENKEVE